MSWEGLATATIGLPVSVPGNIAVAKGTYTEIVDIVAPSSAPAGARVDVTIRIKNTWSASVHIAAVGVWDSEERFIDWLDYWISPGSTHSFSGSFIMPARDVTIHAYSYYEAADGYLYFDDEKEKDVDLAAAVWQKLTSQTIAITPIGWQKLATKTVTITPITWQKLATKTVAITPIPVEWVKLASKTVQIAPVAVEWQKLASKTVIITPEEVPWELIQHTISHFAYIYDGDIEVNIATFKIDPFTPSAWAAKKFADALESEARKKGARVLETKVYVDTTPLLWTDIRIEVTGTPLGGEVGAAAGIAIGVPVWLAIILVCLAIIAVIVVATLAFKAIMAEFKHKPGLEEVKPAWGKEALILDIQDAEEYWERPLTPVETLEEMSEEELRDHLDKIAEEEVPEEISPWAIVALVGGLGVLGVGVAAAFAMAKPKE